MAADKRAVYGAAAAAAVATVGGAYLVYAAARRASRRRLFSADSLPVDAFDVVIVGAGPAGATAAHYLAKGGAKVALLEKEHFPRDKICGDAVCTPAINILEDMGVMQALRDAGEAHYADSGGFVSPSGLAYIGASTEKLGNAAACAVKRMHLDSRIATAAKQAGAQLMEGFEVGKDVGLDEESGLWTVKSVDGAAVQGRVLVCADGATSRVATTLGYCTEPPRGVCSRSYIEAGSHNTNFDGVCFYQRESLPGYSALFKHPGDELGYCYYLIPCGKKGWCGDVQESDLKRLHYDAVTKDPFISKALGPAPKLERMKAGSLRLGGQGIKSTVGDQILIVGDAAGHIDPFTGEGIHTAITAGKAAADTVLECRASGDYSAAALDAYRRRWVKAFGYDFWLSKLFADAVYRCPFLLDSCANEMQRVGDSMMARWAEVMTNCKPKTYFFRPDVALPLGFAMLREAWAQFVLRRPDAYKPVEPANGKN